MKIILMDGRVMNITNEQYNNLLEENKNKRKNDDVNHIKEMILKNLSNEEITEGRLFNRMRGYGRVAFGDALDSLCDEGKINIREAYVKHVGPKVWYLSLFKKT